MFNNYNIENIFIFINKILINLQAHNVLRQSFFDDTTVSLISEALSMSTRKGNLLPQELKQEHAYDLPSYDFS